MNPAVLERVIAVLGERAGMEVSGTMRARLHRCLARAAETAGLPPDEYAGRTLTDAAAVQRLIEDMTVHESSFFRDPGQFAALADHVLPALTGPVRIWSAGCANGQEPYSLAMLLLEHGQADGSVIATDVSSHALSYAEAGRYPEAGLRGLTAQRRAAWLAPADATWSIRQPVRRLVTFGQHNLATDPPPFRPGECQVIFCRNVLIYFRPAALLATLAQMRDWLPPGGLVFLGSSESLWQVTDLLELVPVGSAFLYRKPDADHTGRIRHRPSAAAGALTGAGATAATGAATPARPPVRTAPATPPTPPAQPTPPPARPPAIAALAGTEPSRPLPTPVSALLHSGELALAEGDAAAAATAFRQAAYLGGNHPIAHLQLGLALEADGKAGPAARAFRAARTALRRLDAPAAEREFRGYRPEALIQLLDAKLAGERR